MDKTADLLKELTEARGVPGHEAEVRAVVQRHLQPFGTSLIEGGFTDGAPIHLHRTGVPSLVLAVPARHIHTHSAILHRDDYDQALRLLVGLVQRLDESTVAGLTTDTPVEAL